MGSFHNLFGSPNEAHVIIDTEGRYHIKKLVQGSRIGDMLTYARYDKTQSTESFERMARARVSASHITDEQAAALVRQYESDINRYTYLE